MSDDRFRESGVLDQVASAARVLAVTEALLHSGNDLGFDKRDFSGSAGLIFGYMMLIECVL